PPPLPRSLHDALPIWFKRRSKTAASPRSPPSTNTFAQRPPSSPKSKPPKCWSSSTSWSRTTTCRRSITRSRDDSCARRFGIALGIDVRTQAVFRAFSYLRDIFEHVEHFSRRQAPGELRRAFPTRGDQSSALLSIPQQALEAARDRTHRVGIDEAGRALGELFRTAPIRRQHRAACRHRL